MAQRQFNRRRPVRQRKWRLPRFITRGGWPFVLTLAGAAFLLAAGTVLWWSKDLPNPQNINERRVTQSTKILDRTGEHILYEIGDIHRTSVQLEKISRYVRQATLAAEDDQFYSHHGLDFLGILRGVILKPLSGQRAQGGSTITQQLIKNSILTPERTIQRKVKEAVLALELEQRFSKDQILEMYLNDIPYGSQAYGIEAASKTFFAKSANEVSLAEAAILVALPKAPTYYSPYGSHFEDLKYRQEFILGRMAELNMISQQELEAAIVEELQFEQRRESIKAPHFVFYVKELLDAEYGERVVEQGGLNIITTLDVDLQIAAEEVLRENTERLTKLNASNGALTAVDPKTGDIVAMAGSLNYFNEDIDGNVNVAVRHRSPGSSIKPFIYAAAFAAGFTPDTILIDAETDFGQDYKPKNYNLQQYGPVTMRQALSNSLNIPAVKTLYLVGVKKATDLAQAMGMTSLNDPDRYGLSLVLGGGEVRLLDEVAAYSVFANDGLRHPHRAILKVTSNEEILYDSGEVELEGEQVLEPQIARMVTDVLSDNGARALSFGINSPLTLPSRPVAAKTGTTQDFRDGWTMGYTPSLAVGVWTGNNDNSPMSNNAPGVSTAAPIWNAFMRRALAAAPVEQFVRPEPLKNIPHAILRGELPEIKAKYEPATGTVYTLECPVAVGQPRTFKEIHSILFHVRRTNPLGPRPETAENDPQFDRWESAISAWLEKHNSETKDDANKVRYGRSLPTPLCGVENSEDVPKVRIVEPEGFTLTKSPFNITIDWESPKDVKEIRYLWDGSEVAKRGPDESRTVQFSFPADFSGRKTFQALVVTKDDLIGRTFRTFAINPDGSAPSVDLLTPQDGSNISQGSFPQTVKVSASDSSGIELVDILYTKDDSSGTQRIGRTSTPHSSIPNRYEIIWNDADTGTYQIYAVAYDTTGNVKETRKHTVYVE